MSKLEKQKTRIKERIEFLENELKNTLQKKTVGKAIDVGSYTTKIVNLKKELSALK